MEGQVWIGPTCPVVMIGTECADRPYQARLTITDLRGKVIERTETAEDGSFRVALLPGEYIVVPESPQPEALAWAAPLQITVLPTTWIRIDIHYDSGIR